MFVVVLFGGEGGGGTHVLFAHSVSLSRACRPFRTLPSSQPSICFVRGECRPSLLLMIQVQQGTSVGGCGHILVWCRISVGGCGHILVLYGIGVGGCGHILLNCGVGGCGHILMLREGGKLLKL